MSKIILCFFVILALIGCTSSQEQSDSSLTIDKNSYLMNFETASVCFDSDGYYFIDDNTELFYKADDQKAISLGFMRFADGVQADSSAYPAYNNSILEFFTSSDIVLYNNRIYMVFTETKNDNSFTQQICSVDLKGKDFKSELTLDEVPQHMLFNGGKVYVDYFDYENNLVIVNVYDTDFKLLETKEYNFTGGGPRFYVENNDFFATDSPYTLYNNGTIKLSYRLELDNKKWIGVYDNGDLHLEFEDKMVLFVNDQYFYVCSSASPQTYERYNLDGTLDSSIVIDTQIESKGNTPNASNDNDFSFMLKLRGEDIAIGHSANHLFTCNFETGKCEYLDE